MGTGKGIEIWDWRTAYYAKKALKGIDINTRDDDCMIIILYLINNK
jgi:hypothetical protein